jgi:hypothetical protein
MFENDSWSLWHPEPERAFREHDPKREPYASMSREEILCRMRDARGGQEWEFLQEFLVDRCTVDELDYDRFKELLTEHGGLGDEELSYLCDSGGMPTRLIAPSPSSTQSSGDVEGR